jgi:hypothetical protein
MEWDLHSSPIGYPFHPGIWKPKLSLTEERQKQDLVSPGGSFVSHVYIDAIGVLQGVLDEFKGRSQIVARFKSALFWWSTIHKNVDWINYIYYNQQRFVNYTRDVVRGLAKQLGPTSKMAWEN